MRRIVTMSRLQFIAFSRCCFNRLTWICLGIYSVSFFGLFPVLFKNMRYSLYYRNPFPDAFREMDYHMRQNKMRVASASKFWNSHRQNISLDFANKQNDVDINIMIVTTSRHSLLIKGKIPSSLLKFSGSFSTFYMTQKQKLYHGRYVCQSVMLIQSITKKQRTFLHLCSIFNVTPKNRTVSHGWTSKKKKSKIMHFAWKRAWSPSQGIPC